MDEALKRTVRPSCVLLDETYPRCFLAVPKVSDVVPEGRRVQQDAMRLRVQDVLPVSGRRHEGRICSFLRSFPDRTWHALHEMPALLVVRERSRRPRSWRGQEARRVRMGGGREEGKPGITGGG
jgi:hypothetical protein